jgi:hypothetical protein
MRQLRHPLRTNVLVFAWPAIPQPPSDVTPWRLVTGLAPISARLGRVFYHPEAVVLAVEPFGALDPVLDDTRTAGSSQRRDESGSRPLRDGPSTAISTLIKTKPNASSRSRGRLTRPRRQAARPWVSSV